MYPRKIIRLQDYDYTREGLYFITICCYKHACYFGHVSQGEMVLNEIGNIASKCWSEIPNHFPQTALHEFVIMPNHMHGIIELIGKPVGSRHGVTLQHGKPNTSNHENANKFGKPISGSIPVIVNQYKASVKRWCNQNGHDHFSWQRRYHEHIIRHAHAYRNISEYIRNNPLHWEKDDFYM